MDFLTASEGTSIRTLGWVWFHFQCHGQNCPGIFWLLQRALQWELEGECGFTGSLMVKTAQRYSDRIRGHLTDSFRMSIWRSTMVSISCSKLPKGFLIVQEGTSVTISGWAFWRACLKLCKFFFVFWLHGSAPQLQWRASLDSTVSHEEHGSLMLRNSQGVSDFVRVTLDCLRKSAHLSLMLKAVVDSSYGIKPHVNDNFKGTLNCVLQCAMSSTQQFMRVLQRMLHVQNSIFCL